MLKAGKIVASPVRDLYRNAATSLNLRKHRSGLAFEINHERGGLFAQLNWCIYLYNLGERHGVPVQVKLTSANYRPRAHVTDWLSYHFDGPGTVSGKEDVERHVIRLTDIKQVGSRFLPKNLSLETARDLFGKNLRLKPVLQTEIDAFVNRWFSGRRVLGLHYRGTDKSLEAERVTFEAAATRIQDILKARGYDALFVSSDESIFIEYLKATLRNVDIVIRDDTKRSSGNEPIHLGAAASEENGIARDALVNCFLLSRCNELVRTTSFLSAWSVVLNPNLQVELLNRPHPDKLWFPENEILKRTGPAKTASA